jgi:hypothetical protein
VAVSEEEHHIMKSLFTFGVCVVPSIMCFVSLLSFHQFLCFDSCVRPHHAPFPHMKLEPMLFFP